MTYGVRLHIWGERALFARPETKVERVSYDIITPSAARGILEAVYWKPAIRWVIDSIHVLKAIRFESIRRNEVGHKIPETTARRAMNAGVLDGLAIAVEDDRQQRAATVLKDVAYVISARFEMTARAGNDDNEGKHLDCFKRRARKGQCFHRPCLGTREFAADFELVEGDVPQPHESLRGERDLGLMLHDIDFANGMNPHFFHAVLHDGVLTVPPFSSRMRGAP